MKKLLLTILVLLNLSVHSIAQQQYSTELISTNVKGTDNPSDWQLYFDNQEIKIEYKFVDCDPVSGMDNESVLLRFTNNSSNKLLVSWHLHLSYDGTCRTCDYPEEYGYEMSIEPNEVIEGDCDDEEGYKVKIFSKFIDENYSKGAQLTAFQLANLEIIQF